MWTSPDIWVRHANAGIPIHQNPEFGQTNWIHGFIRNRGTVTPQNVRVEFWVANASTGLSWPTQWTFVGSTLVSGPPPGPGTITVSVPWNPPGVGHFCIVSRIVSAQDPMTFPEGTNISLNTQNNNNIVWRNVNIVNLTGPPPAFGGGSGLSSLGVAAAANGAPAIGNETAKAVTVEFIFRNFEERDRELELAFVGDTNEDGTRFRDRGRVTITVSEEFRAYMEEQGLEGGVGLERIDDLTFGVAEDDAYFVLPAVQPGQEFTFQMTFEDLAVNTVPPTEDNPDATQTVTHVFHAVQREPGLEPEGGVTYEIQVLPLAAPAPVPTAK
jgi:extracellular elastinolytic metalloproteinase